MSCKPDSNGAIMNLSILVTYNRKVYSSMYRSWRIRSPIKYVELYCGISRSIGERIIICIISLSCCNMVSRYINY